MTPVSGLLRRLEGFFAHLFAALGVVLIVFGLGLLLSQAYQWVSLGIWGQMPASSLFIESRIPIDLVHVPDEIKKNLLTDQAPAPVRTYRVYRNLYGLIPDSFRSDSSWLANPKNLHGLHIIVIWILDFISIAAMLILAGALYLGVGLSRPRGDLEWQYREPTL